MNHRRHRRLFAALAIAVAVVVGAAFTTACKPSAPTAGNEHGHDGNALGTIGTPDQAFKRDPALTGPINVVCTTGMIADVTRRVGGEFVTVTQLMNFVSDPHSYKATEGDVRALSGAEVIFYNGLMLEGKMSDLFARMSSKRLTVPVGEAVPQELRREVAGHPDPHIWFDVSLWQRATKLICEALANYDNLHAEKIRRNWRKVDADLDQLHQVAKQHIAQIPKERRVLVTAHDAFGYFGRAYDIEVRAIQGISTEDEAGVAAINELKQ
ncbi:MAG: metal ABC transporter solute-binding protein, Zn/Mn family, partial [Planctomycetota bacterium]